MLWTGTGSFFKESVKGISFCCSGGGSACAALCKRKAIAEICTILIDNPVSLRLTALIVGACLIKPAVQAAVLISVAVRARVGAADPVAGINGIFTAVAAGHCNGSPV